MEKQHPYNNIIENKLGDLPGADVNQLWTGMQAILDKNMPHEEKKPRFFGWFFSGKGLFLLGSISLISVWGLAFFYFSPKNSTDTKAASFTGTTSKANNTANNKNSHNTQAGTLTVTPNAADQNANGNSVSTFVNNVQGEVDRRQSTQSTSTAIVAGFVIKKGNTFSNKNQTSKQPLAFYQDKAGSGLPHDYKNTSIPRSLFTASISKISPEDYHRQPGIGADSIPSNGDPLKSLLRKQRDSIATAINKKQKDRGAYVGIMAGLDVSSVNFTAMKTGNNKGIIAGYSFSKRWSVETGLFWNKKRFFGNGNDFKPTGYTLPAGVEMVSVYGVNQLYEWPVNVKFTIIPKKHNLFVTAGLSSYFTKTESYDYEYLFNGQPGRSYSTYKNQSKDLFSVANFSLGYTHSLGRIGCVRVEPYLKLPINDIGINNMPVVSTGLNVGFTRQILR